MTLPLCVATGGWCRRVFHYRPPTPMYRNSPPLCTIVLQIPSLVPLKMRKVQFRSGLETRPAPSRKRRSRPGPPVQRAQAAPIPVPGHHHSPSPPRRRGQVGTNRHPRQRRGGKPGSREQRARVAPNFPQSLTEKENFQDMNTQVGKSTGDCPSHGGSTPRRPLLHGRLLRR